MAKYTKSEREIKDDKLSKGKQINDKVSTSSPASADHIFNGWIDDCGVSKKMGMFSKRKRDAADVAPAGPLVNGCNDTGTSVAGAAVSFPSNCKSGDCVEVRNTPKASDLLANCIGTEHLSASSNQHGVNLGIESLLKVSPRKCVEQKVVEKQRKEMEEFSKTAVKKKIQLVEKKNTDEAVIRLLRTGVTRSATLEKLNEKYQMKKVELNEKMNARLKNLVAMQVEARKKVLERKGMWVEAVRSFRSWTRNKLRLSNSTNLFRP